MRSRDLTTSCGWATSKGDDGSLVASTLFAGTRLMLPTSTKARVYIGITLLGGLLSLSLGLFQGKWTEPSRYVCYLALALLASGMKVSLPGVHGTMSVIFLFILIGVRELTLAQTLLMGVLGTVIQRSEEHTSELQSRLHLVCRLLLEKKKQRHITSKTY